MNLLYFFFNDTATTEIYTLSLHDALPIYARDDRLRETRQRHHHPAALVEQPALPRFIARVRAHLLEVVARAKPPPLGTEDDHAYRCVAGNRVQLRLQRGDHLGG